MLKPSHAVPLAAALLAMGGFAADESAGRALTAPALRSMQVAATTASISGGQATVEMQIRFAGQGSSLAWTMPPFKWVPMDEEDRDPAFSELRVSADGTTVDIQRSAAAWLDGHDISADLLTAQIDIAHISLGDIDALPSADSLALNEGVRAHAYFHDVDGTLFPAWETRIHAWAEIPVATHGLSYTYRLRPGYFLIAGRPDAAAKRIAVTCKPKSGMMKNLRASLAQGNLVCLYHVPLPNSGSASLVQWRSSSEANDDYICSASGNDTARKVHGVATVSGAGLTEVRAISITKGDHCEH